METFKYIECVVLLQNEGWKHTLMMLGD